MKRGAIIIGSALVAASIAAEPNIEFSGVLLTDGRPTLALTNKSTGTTRWVDPGAEFNGYTVARYVPDEEAVLLRKDAEEVRLLLVAPKPASEANNQGGRLRPASPSLSRRSPSRPAPAPASEPPQLPEPNAGPAAASGSATITRSIAPGETWETIARASGLSVEQLQALNPTVNEGSLQPGQLIRIR